MIKFQAKYLPMLFPFMAKKDVRYYLNGVYIEPADVGVYLVATDGHKMAVIHDAEGECAEARVFSLRRDAMRFCKGQEPYAPFVTIDPASQRLMVADTVEERYLQPGKCFIEGKYPDWRRILPDFKKLSPGSPATMNATYLSEVAAISPKHRGFSAMRLWSMGTENDPVVIQFGTIPEMLGIVMPVRGYGDLSFSPELQKIFKKGK